jgi:CBS-domain-containing membrane protein
MEFPSPVRADRSTPGPKATERAQLNADYLGLSALIDFRYECPVTVDADSSINDARAQMIQLGVDALLVTEDGLEKTKPRLVGLIAAADIERERTHHVARARDFSNAICAGEAVTPWDDLPVMNYESLHTLPMHALCEMFRHTGLKHLLVLEIHDDELLARGLLSRSTISKHLRRTGRDSR